MVTKAVKILWGADDKDYRAALNRIERQTQATTQRLDRMNQTATRGFLASTAASVGLIKLHREQEQAEYQMAAAIANAGKQREISIEYVKQYSSALQRSSIYGDEAAIQASVFALRLGNLNKEQLPRSIRLFADYAAVMGVELPRASRQLAKYLADPTQGMTRLAQAGITLDEATKDYIRTLVEQGKITEAQNFLMGELEKKFGGASEALLDGTGIIIATKNAVFDLGERIGEVLFRYLRPWFFRIKEITEGLIENEEFIEKVGTGLKRIVVGTGALIFFTKLAALLYGARTAMLALVTAAKTGRITMAAFWTTSTLGLSALVAFWPEIAGFFDKVVAKAKLAGAEIEIFFRGVDLKIKRFFVGLGMGTEGELAAKQSKLDAAIARRIEARKELAEKAAKTGPVKLPGIGVDAIGTDTAGPERFAEHDAKAEARRRAQAEKEDYERETELEKLRMHLQNKADIDIEFYERQRELEWERRELENIEDDEKKAAELEKNRLHFEVLEKQKRDHAAKMLKDSKKAHGQDRKQLASQFRQLFAMHTAAGKAAFLAEQALKISELIMSTPANAQRAFTNAMAAYPPPKNVAIAKLMYGLTVAAGAAGVAATAAATYKQLKGKMKGGMIGGDPTRGDAYPYLVQAGETIVPRGDYRDLEAGIRAKVRNEDTDEYEPAAPGPAQTVMVEFAGDAGQLLRQVTDGNDILRI